MITPAEGKPTRDSSLPGNRNQAGPGPLTRGLLFYLSRDKTQMLPGPKLQLTGQPSRGPCAAHSTASPPRRSAEHTRRGGKPLRAASPGGESWGRAAAS